MKVKYLLDDNRLIFEGEYNVFSIEESDVDGRRIYIGNSNGDGGYHISPHKFEVFEIIDTKISKFWEYGTNDFGDICIGIKEVFLEENFWERYFTNDPKISEVLNQYFKVGEEELFNKF